MTQKGGKRWAKEKDNEMSRWLFLKPVIVAAVTADKCLEGDISQNDLGKMKDEAGIKGRKSAFKLFSSFQMGSFFLLSFKYRCLPFPPMTTPTPAITTSLL